VRAEAPPDQTRTPAGDALTRLVLEIFSISGRLHAAGDKLGHDVKLSSARWHVMGAVRHQRKTVAQIARESGLRRQSIQRVVNTLVDDGLVGFEDNPNHLRAKLVFLTPAGEQALGHVAKRQAGWANRLAEGLSVDEVDTASRVLKHLHTKLR
jgi:DNA-binding MarR family transcriptional regulator